MGRSLRPMNCKVKYYLFNFGRKPVGERLFRGIDSVREREEEKGSPVDILNFVEVFVWPVAPKL
jgi:hypothetical protein